MLSCNKMLTFFEVCRYLFSTHCPRLHGIQNTPGCDALNSSPAKLFASRDTISESIRRRYVVDAGEEGSRRTRYKPDIMGVFSELEMGRLILYQNHLKRGLLGWTLLLLCIFPGGLMAQSTTSPPSITLPGSQSPYTGSEPDNKATPEVLQLSFQDAIDRGLRTNLGLLLSGDQTIIRHSPSQPRPPRHDFDTQRKRCFEQVRWPLYTSGMPKPRFRTAGGSVHRVVCPPKSRFSGR